MRKRRSMPDERGYRSSKPIPVRYGLRTSKQQGKIGETWWSQRWIRALEEVQVGARLARGRSYARRGQVLDMEVQPGRVIAHVQGSRPQPYQVAICLRTFSEEEWRTVITTLAARAVFAAKLLAGEMPHDIERVCDAAGVSLFPKTMNDLQTECSCPDWANPCKHIAAVHYLLADSFDKDPFLLFALRGKTKDQILAALREERGGGAEEQACMQDTLLHDATEAEWLRDFWRPGTAAERFMIRPARPAVHMALLVRLGRGPFKEIKPVDTFSAAYDIMSASALEEASS